MTYHHEMVALSRLNSVLSGVNDSVNRVLSLPDTTPPADLIQAALALEEQRHQFETAVQILRDTAQRLLEIKEEPYTSNRPNHDDNEPTTASADLLVQHHHEEQPSSTRCLPMISSYSSLRISWDLVLAALLLFIVIVEPLSLGFLPLSATRSDTIIGIVGSFIDGFFVLDLVLNFRTGYLSPDGNVEILDPGKCARNYLRTWFTLDFASSFPPIIEVLVVATTSSSGSGLDGLNAAKILKLGRVFKVFKILRVAKLAKLTSEDSALGDYVEDVLASESSMFALRLFLLAATCVVLAHLIACFMAASGNGWFRNYNPYGDDEESANDWGWRRRYVVALYFAFTTMTTVGYGDITPATDTERWFAIAAMVIGVGFYSYLLATISSIVTASDAKSAIYYEKMDQLSSWMRHYRFDSKLRRRTRSFFKRFYTQRSAIDERAILETLAPSLQDQVSQLLLHDYVKFHPIFRELPEGVLWRVLLITRTISFENGATVAHRNDLSLGLYIMQAGKAMAEYALLDSCDRDSATSRLSAASNNADGDPTVRATQATVLEPGSSFGELCLLGSVTRSLVTVTTLAPCDFFFIQRDGFLDAFSNLPEVLRSIMQRSHLFDHRPVWQSTKPPTSERSLTIPT